MTDAELPSDATDLPLHMQEALKAISHLHAEHARRATLYDRITERITDIIGRPRFAAWLFSFVGLWLASNAILSANHKTSFDPPPYNWLQVLLALTAVATTSLILGAQRRADDLSQRQGQLTLQLSILTERKVAKTIELIEELRRDLPNIDDREDPEASAMAEPADAATVIGAIEKHAAAAEAGEANQE